VCFLFLDPQNEFGPSISSSVILCSFALLVYIVTLVFVFCLCPSSVRVVATFPGSVLFPLLYSVLPFFPNTLAFRHINPLNPELNPICYLLALLGAHHFHHVSRIKVKSLTFRRLMSYIYIYMEHPFLMFLDHTQRRSTVGRTPLDE